MGSTAVIIFLSIVGFVACSIYAFSIGKPKRENENAEWPTMSSKGTEKKYEIWPYYLKPCLSNPEQVIFHRLITALPDHMILSQVGLSRILGVKKNNKFAVWNNKINRMSVDFVVCDKSAAVKYVIELDDSTHLRADRVVADAKKDKALLDAGLNIIRWNVKSLPAIDEIKEQFKQSNGAEVDGISNICPVK